MGGLNRSYFKTKKVVNQEVLMKATGATAQNAAKFLPSINSILSRHGINTPERVLAFLAQIGQESGGLRWTEELASGSAYEGRGDLGNTQSGDGVRYKGRGLIGITGRTNYKWMSNALGEDFISHPEKISEPKWAVETAAYFWSHHPKGDLSKIADKMDVKKSINDTQNDTAYRLITKRINGAEDGPQTHLNVRKSLWSQGQDSVIKWVKKHPLRTMAIGAFILIGIGATIYLLMSNKNKIITTLS